MESIIIKKYNETYNTILCDPDIAQELSEYFTFYVPGYKFMPAYRNKMWDGKLRLFNTRSKTLLAGLNEYVETFCKERNYLIEYDGEFVDTEFSLKEAVDFILDIKPTMKPREYQVEAFVHAVRKSRSLLLSPTASGKSFIIYLLARYYNARTLIIVPTTSLVSQLASDFADYGFASDKHVHRIYSGQDKQTDKQITISTWQSIYKLPKEYFEQFDLVIGDEAHLFKAKSLMTIMEKLSKCKYRFGFTGTLDGTQTHRLVLEGLFGSVKKVTTTAELIEQKHLADFNIKSIILSYPDETRKLISKASYQDEIDYLVTNIKRNNFIKNLTLSLKGNTLLLFQFVDKHGKVLYDMINTEVNDRKVFFVSGKVDGDEREEIRKIVENYKNNRIIMEFDEYKVDCEEDTDVLLTNGKYKKAKNITENDDIDASWILNNKK